ncbi:hypothetical protein PPYR_10331 [Photinus pyralis]|uniref:Uncharacterized protein n=1 Tax=Photinus pyralis TaxID=7054 RepID=A0A5N4AFZ4_PHOPY|nr:hypothetical protein PPYR_10331 [Photinus pyralis]
MHICNLLRFDQSCSYTVLCRNLDHCLNTLFKQCLDSITTVTSRTTKKLPSGPGLRNVVLSKNAENIVDEQDNVQVLQDMHKDMWDLVKFIRKCKYRQPKVPN